MGCQTCIRCTKDLYKTPVSKDPAGAVFIPVIVHNLYPMAYTEQGHHPLGIKHEKLSYDVLTLIINLAAEGSNWLQHVFVCAKEPLTFMV